MKTLRGAEFARLSKYSSILYILMQWRSVAKIIGGLIFS